LKILSFAIYLRAVLVHVTKFYFVYEEGKNLEQNYTWQHEIEENLQICGGTSPKRNIIMRVHMSTTFLSTQQALK